MATVSATMLRSFSTAQLPTVKAYQLVTMFYVIAFLKKGSRFKMYIADPEGGEYLVLMRKRKRDYNYETNQHFTYAMTPSLRAFLRKPVRHTYTKTARFELSSRAIKLCPS